MGSSTVSLAELRPGERGVVVALGGACAVGRLAALGFTPGAEVAVARNAGRGPLIVSLLGTQGALGRGQAMRILVRRSAS